LDFWLLFGGWSCESAYRYRLKSIL
jgi:hypothetical protein